MTGRVPWYLGDTGRVTVAGATGAVVGIAFGVVVPNAGDGWMFQLVYWNVLAATYVLLSCVLFARQTPEQLAAWATGRDRPLRGTVRRLFAGRTATSSLWFVVYGSVYGLLVAGYVLPRAGELAPQQRGLLTGLAFAAIVASWLAAHTGYTFHYAYLYHRNGARGLAFPGDAEPALLDVAYFSFAVGTTFGTTDVEVTTRRMRRSVLLHGLFAFAFNSAILAVAVAYLTTA